MSISYKDWYIPYQQDNISLRQAKQSMASVQAQEEEIPLMVQLVENPRYQIPGFRLFHGAVDLEQHDFIHIVLGRGLLEKDEAFTIGFTMGTTNKVTTTEEILYSMIAQYLYPRVYKFDKDDIEVFRNAVRLGYISSCVPLDEFDFKPYLDKTLAEVRQQVGIERELLLAYYKIEQQRYPGVKECDRLLDQSSSVLDFKKTV